MYNKLSYQMKDNYHVAKIQVDFGSTLPKKGSLIHMVLDDEFFPFDGEVWVDSIEDVELNDDGVVLTIVYKTK